jgi:hypothetical protein
MTVFEQYTDTQGLTIIDCWVDIPEWASTIYRNVPASNEKG